MKVSSRRGWAAVYTITGYCGCPCVSDPVSLMENAVCTCCRVTGVECSKRLINSSFSCHITHTEGGVRSANPLLRQHHAKRADLLIHTSFSRAEHVSRLIDAAGRVHQSPDPQSRKGSHGLFSSRVRVTAVFPDQHLSLRVHVCVSCFRFRSSNNSRSFTRDIRLMIQRQQRQLQTHTPLATVRSLAERVCQASAPLDGLVRVPGSQ